MYYCTNENNVKQNIRHNIKYKLIKGNCVNNELVTNILEEYNITHVIHFVDQSPVQNSFEDSLQYTHDNILGTHVLLKCCRKYGKIERFIHVSTDEVYKVAKILIEMIKEKKDYDKWITYIEDRPFNDQRYYINNQKLKNLGWEINVNFIDGLKNLIFDDYKINL
ncbi:GDP-mannose 4,6 dehydratase [seawater metagenome]|uniref:GDP-mannose 4,6 dehydratase n=1 Tax=seawater metagenome TaxID=1561972 RepID=A0A5E8CIY7_9ZZZZ